MSDLDLSDTTEEPAKLDRLSALAAAVRGKGRGTSGDRLERALLIAGSVLLPLGALIVLLGWYGAARTPYLFEQIPYLISGGIFGATLCIAGGFCYFGYWLAKLVHDQQVQTQQIAAALEGLQAVLGNGHASAAAVGSGGGGGSSVASGNGSPLVATATGTMAHRPSCSIVTGKSGLRRVRSVNAGPQALQDLRTRPDRPLTRRFRHVAGRSVMVAFARRVFAWTGGELAT